MNYSGGNHGGKILGLSTSYSEGLGSNPSSANVLRGLDASILNCLYIMYDRCKRWSSYRLCYLWLPWLGWHWQRSELLKRRILLKPLLYNVNCLNLWFLFLFELPSKFRRKWTCKLFCVCYYAGLSRRPIACQKLISWRRTVSRLKQEERPV